MHRLVVIDDEYIVVEGIKAIIRREKLECEVAGFAYDGISALTVIREQKPDIVITDIRIPGLDGLSLIEEAKEILPETSFIVISGYTEFEYARKALSLGVRSYIDKPVTIEKVKEAIALIDEENEFRRQARKRLKTIENFRNRQDERTRKMILAVVNENAAVLRDEAGQAFMEMQEFYETEEEYRQESFKTVCMITEVFAEQKREKARKYTVVWKDVEDRKSLPDITDYMMEAVNRIADFMEVEKVGSNHKTVNQLLEYIEKNYARDIGLNELAEQVKLNPAYLSILFKEEVGTSYVKYLTGLRVGKAKELLDKGYKVIEVSEMVGYSNYRYFCDIFKKLTGKTPNEYKQRE